MTDPRDAEARRPLAEVGPAGLAERLEDRIAERACGRIRDLRVVCEAGHIIIKGNTRTYHARQLALQAVLDLTDGHSILADEIVVS